MKYLVAYGIIACLFFSGCKKFIDISDPVDQIASGYVYKSNETANAAMTGIYSRMFTGENSSPYYICALTGLYADELSNNNPAFESIYSDKIDPAAGNESNNLWKECYKLIYYANSVLEGCDKSGSLDGAVKSRLMGEALFIRAYWNFYLVNLYGDIPLAVSTDYTVNSKLVRKPVAEVYQQIITDLKTAQSYLDEQYFSAAGVMTESERIRPNKGAATALLARVYLYTGDYVSAEEQSSLLIGNNGQYALAPIGDVFLAAGNKEAIWQLMPIANADRNTHEGANFIPTTSPITESRPTVSSQLANAFQTGDLRMSEWIGSIVDGGVKYYFPYKYKIQSGGENPTEFSVILRLAEQYLIRAEARAQQNNLTGAISDIDMIRERAGIPLITNINRGISKEDLLTAILKERQVEFFTEQGQRWFDLKRVKRANAVMELVTPLKGGGAWDTRKQLWPVPQTEISNNPGLIQNPGY